MSLTNYYCRVGMTAKITDLYMTSICVLDILRKSFSLSERMYESYSILDMAFIKQELNTSVKFFIEYIYDEWHNGITNGI